MQGVVKEEEKGEAAIAVAKLVLTVNTKTQTGRPSHLRGVKVVPTDGRRRRHSSAIASVCDKRWMKRGDGSWNTRGSVGAIVFTQAVVMVEGTVVRGGGAGLLLSL
jgi:hypothetical protein